MDLGRASDWIQTLEPVGYEPSTHPIRRRLWLWLSDALARIRLFLRIQAKIDDWAWETLMRSKAYDEKPIYPEADDER